MAVYPTLDTVSKLRSADFSADGALFDLWAGPVRMAFGGSYEKDGNSNIAVSYNVAASPVASTSKVSGSRESYAAFTELAVPLVGKANAIPLVRRLEFQLAGRYEDRDEAGTSTVPKLGASWVPVSSLLLRTSYSEGFRAPALTEYEVANRISTGNILIDPKRSPASTSGISISRGSSIGIKPETSQTEFYGAVFEPPFVKGLNLQLNYYRTTQQNVIQELTAQTIINNEASFPGRITRAAPTAADTAAGQPGQITAVDLTFINFGAVRNHSLDFVADYTLPWQQLGRWRVGGSATKTLKSTRELGPGQPAINDEGDTYGTPAWKMTGSLFWNRGPWQGSVFVNYLSGFNSNQAGNSLTWTYPIPAVAKTDIRGGYEFKRGVWRGYAKGLRVNLGVSNLFDKEPPFSDTIFGYNGGLHGFLALGRSYEFSANLPF